jgi:hypothetical protein
LVRSLSYLAAHKQVTDVYFDNCVADFIADLRLYDLFRASYGRSPMPAELEILVARPGEEAPSKL